MPVELTANNVQAVLGVYAERYYTVMPEVFEELLKPDIDEMVLYTYTKAIRDQLEKDHRPDGHMGFDSFEEACFEGGIVKTMLKIAQDPRTGRWPGLAAYFALDSMWQLMRTGTTEERRELLKQVLEHDALNICLNKAENSPLAIQRSGAVNVLRCLASESFLGEYLSVEQTSKVVMKLCQYILSGPQIFIDQFSNAAMTWQSFLSFGNFGASRTKAGQYAPRYYAMSQESAAWTIQGLFLRSPPASQQFCLDVLKHDPSILELMFQAASVKRPPWYAELAVDSIMAEAITLLFRVPDLKVPGVPTKLWDEALQKTSDDEWAAVLESVQILLSQPKWAGFLLGVWHMLEDERYQDVKRMLMEGQAKYHAQHAYDLETFMGVFEYRGSARLCIERLIATISYATTQISEEDLLSLLSISSAACLRPVKSVRQVSSEVDQYNFIENGFELFRKPLYCVFTEEEVEPPLQIANAPCMAPTAHARLLTLLAQSGGLLKITKLSKLPNAISSRLSVAQLKQFVSPDAIHRFLALSKQRITSRRESGHKRFRNEDELDYAMHAYVTAAELAGSLIAFDQATEGRYKSHTEGVRRELVLCLGNAAEMALGLNQFKRALCYATGAVDSAEDLPTSGSPDAVDDSIKIKNRRRVARAKAGLSGAAV